MTSLLAADWHRYQENGIKIAIDPSHVVFVFFQTHLSTLAWGNLEVKIPSEEG